MKSLKSMTVLLCLLCLSLSSMAQVINWTTGLNWATIQEKAKKENKYIFLDFFATWCGPCKKMEKEVYVNDTVASFFNASFIAVKVQMDKTKADAPEVQSWYAEAEQLGKQFKIQAFPTYVFVAPDGNVSHQVSGYQNVEDFVAIAKTALVPGRKYNDPNEKYYALLKQFEQGKMEYSQMPSLIDKAEELQDLKSTNAILKQYKDYVRTLKPAEWLKPDILRVLSRGPIYTTSRLSASFFNLFYTQTKKINSVLKKTGFAEKVVENVIYSEEALPFMKTAGYGKKLDAGAELDWNKLAEMIAKKYPKPYVDRTILIAKIDWYGANRNTDKFYKNYLQYIDQYGLEQIDKQGQMAPGWVNYHAWGIFTTSTDKKLLETTAKWMAVVIESEPGNFLYIDTYANLLYKLGKTKEALLWEEKALKLAHEWKDEQGIKECTVAIQKMKKGEPTWN
jgi:thioredoxin-related protein